MPERHGRKPLSTPQHCGHNAVPGDDEYTQYRWVQSELQRAAVRRRMFPEGHCGH